MIDDILLQSFNSAELISHWQTWSVSHELFKPWSTYNIFIYAGRAGSLVDSTPFVWRVAVSNPTLAATLGPWASALLAVDHGASAWNADTVSVLYHECLWVVVDVKRHYRNSLNEWMNEWMNIASLLNFPWLVATFKHLDFVLLIKGHSYY